MSLSPLIQKLLFIKKFSINKGKIEILENRYSMIDAGSLLALQDIDQSKMYQSAKNSSKENINALVNHAKVYKNIKGQELKNIAELSKKIGESEKGTINTLQNIFNIYGLGEMEVTSLKNDKKEAVVRIRESALAVKRLQKGKSKKPICSLTAGILAGIFSFLFKENVDAYEKECLAKGDDYCVFIIKKSS